MVGPARPLFVLFGSSIVQFSYINGGWGAILADIFSRKADILLRGYSAWNSRRALQVIDQVFPKDAATQPALVIVYFGGNDSMHPHPSGLGPHVPLPEYIENMRKIAIHIKSLSEATRVLFLSAPPLNKTKVRELMSNILGGLVRTNEDCHRYSDACLELCREMDVKAVDLWTALQKRDDWLTACFTDGVHLSSEGSKIVVREILKVLKEANWEPSLHWKSLPTEFDEVSPYDHIGPDGRTTVMIPGFSFHKVMVAPVRPHFVLFGSSIVQLSYSNEGWGAILTDIYARKADILLRGYSGWNSRCALQVLDQVFPKDAAMQPSLVIVYFGGNDSMRPHPSGLSRHVPLPEYIENMRKIAVHLKSLSETTRVLFLTAPPVNEAKLREQMSDKLGKLDRTNELCHIYSEACLELCREMEIKAVDLWTALQKRDDWLTTCFTDGVHLSSEGSKIVVEEILMVLKEANWEPSLHWKSLPTEFAEDSPFDPVCADSQTTINVSELSFHREIEWN